jgi:hypothetical protein
MNQVSAVLLLAFLSVSCGSEGPAQTATGPAPTGGSPVPGGGNSVSGVVVEYTSSGVRPLPGAFVNTWIDLGSSGYSYWYKHGQVVADAAGRYQLSDLPSSSVWLQAWIGTRGDYVQQCAAPMVRVSGAVTADIQLVSKANLFALSSSPPTPAPGTRFVSGMVFKDGVSGREPVVGAFVAFEPYESIETIAADTVTDAAGRYLLCGLPEERPVSIGACVQPCDGLTRVSVPPGQSTGADIQLTDPRSSR